MKNLVTEFEENVNCCKVNILKNDKSSNEQINNAIIRIKSLYNDSACKSIMFGEFKDIIDSKTVSKFDDILRVLINNTTLMSIDRKDIEDLSFIKGKIYFINGMYDKAKEKFLYTIDRDDSTALAEFYLGQIYYFGYGEEKNYNQAREYIFNSFRKGNLRATYFLKEYFNSEAESKLEQENLNYIKGNIKCLLLNVERNLQNNYYKGNDIHAKIKNLNAQYNYLQNLFYIVDNEDKARIAEKLLKILNEYTSISYSRDVKFNRFLEYKKHEFTQEANPKLKDLDDNNNKNIKGHTEKQEFLENSDALNNDVLPQTWVNKTGRDNEGSEIVSTKKTKIR